MPCSQRPATDSLTPEIDLFVQFKHRQFCASLKAAHPSRTVHKPPVPLVSPAFATLCTATPSSLHRDCCCLLVLAQSESCCCPSSVLHQIKQKAEADKPGWTLSGASHTSKLCFPLLLVRGVLHSQLGWSSCTAPYLYRHHIQYVFTSWITVLERCN